MENISLVKGYMSRLKVGLEKFIPTCLEPPSRSNSAVRFKQKLKAVTVSHPQKSP
jgi:hypothetical protein